MKMHNPPHPGEVLSELCLKPAGLTVTEAASALGVSRKTLSMIINGRAGISPEMAVRLSIAFDTTAESWLAQQIQYDLAAAERRRRADLARTQTAGRQRRLVVREVALQRKYADERREVAVAIRRHAWPAAAPREACRC